MKQKIFKEIKIPKNNIILGEKHNREETDKTQSQIIESQKKTK